MICYIYLFQTVINELCSFISVNACVSAIALSMTRYEVTSYGFETQEAKTPDVWEDGTVFVQL